MSVRNAMQWRRTAGKVCGAGFLVMLGVLVALNEARVHFYDSGIEHGDWKYYFVVRVEAWALGLTLILASALLLIVAIELSIVAWRLLRRRRPD